MTKQIPLTQGKVALVDDDMFEYLNQWKWYVEDHKQSGLFYAKRGEWKWSHQLSILMHRVIMSAPDGFVVDHINGNGLDNRRENLRICTVAENIHNQKKSTLNTTGYKGVSVYRQHNYPNYVRYQAKIRVAGKLLHLGLFRTAEEAARAYDRAAREHFGPYARTNFPE